MTSYASAAVSLTNALHLSWPPIAVCLADSVPDGIPHYTGSKLPAGCVFWQEASKGVFTTSANDHNLCAIGMHTHNLETSQSEDTDREDALKVFAELGYLRPDQIPDIPVLAKRPKHVVYAPLADSPLPPDVILLFVEANQGLVLSEASQAVENGMPPAMGRPACGVVPAVKNSGRAALSLGCCGARAYLDTLTPNLSLWALPGPRLAEYVDRVAELSKANEVLTRFHKLRRKDVEAGGAPSVQQSLVRLEAQA